MISSPLHRTLLVGLLRESNVTLLFLQIIYSLHTNKDNTQRWPKVVSDDVSRHAHKLKNEVFVVGGQVKGRTFLPLPENSDALGDSEHRYLSHTQTPPIPSDFTDFTQITSHK